MLLVDDDVECNSRFYRILEEILNQSFSKYSLRTQVLVLTPNTALLNLVLPKDKGINNRAIKQLEHVDHPVAYGNPRNRAFLA